MGSHTRANRAHWNAKSERYQASFDPFIGRAPKLWGSFAIPDERLGALGPVPGLDVLELGCGGGQWAGALEAEGARVVGLDLSEAQLRAARRRSASLPLVQADGEVLPFRDGSFDVVLSDHGALGWGDPQRVVPEAARVLRRGGRLVFNLSSPWATICYDEERNVIGTTMQTDYFGVHRFAEDETGAATYNLPYGQWIRLFRRNGLVVDDLIEIQPRASEVSPYYRFEPPDWFTRWPAETLWLARRVE